MPCFSRTSRKPSTAPSRSPASGRHEYATLEHLLLALTEDQDAAAGACAPAASISTACAHARRISSTTSSRASSPRAPSEPKPTAGFQRVIQRAVVHVQSSGREEVTGANVLVAMFSERESHAVYLPAGAGHDALDAVNYISHGIAKRPGMSEPARVARRRRGRRAAREAATRRQPATSALDAYCVNLNKKAQGRQDRSADRPRARGRAHDPGAVPPAEEQPALVGDPGVGKTAIAEGLARKIVEGEVPEVLEERDDLRARHGRAAGRHALSRRLRGAAEGGADGAREAPERDPVHRRDPHRDRRRRDLGRRDGRVEPAEAGARSRATLRCIGSTTYKEYRQYFEKDRALVRRFQKIDVNEPSIDGRDRDPEGAEARTTRSTTSSATPTRRSRRRSSCRRATSTTASCPTRRST